MSYEPTLVINAKQLHDKKTEIEMDVINYPEDKAIQYIADLLNSTVTSIDRIKLIICSPELTSFNRDVRDTLYTYGVEYAEVN